MIRFCFGTQKTTDTFPPSIMGNDISRPLEFASNILITDADVKDYENEISKLLKKKYLERC